MRNEADEGPELTPERMAEIRAEMSDCAAFLLPLARLYTERDTAWPAAEICAWLTMVRDTMATRDKALVN